MAAELVHKVKTDFDPEKKLSTIEEKANKKAKKQKLDVTSILTPDLECNY